MSTFSERHKRRKNIKNSYTINENVNEVLVNEFLNTPIDYLRVQQDQESIRQFYDISVSDNEVDEFLDRLKKDFNDARFNQLINDCKKDVINSIVAPFGIGKYIVAGYDKAGGNVTTLQNFEKGIVATEEDQQRYTEWQDSKHKFNRQPYDNAQVRDKNGNPIKNNNDELISTKPNKFNSDYKKHRSYKAMENGESISDGYTGKVLGEKQGNNINKNKSIDLEHITSASEIEKDVRNHLYNNNKNQEDRQNHRVKMATDDANLTLIEGKMNSSKNDKDLIEWMNSPVSKEHAKETGKANMTNAEYYGVDTKLAKEKYDQSKKMIKRKQLVEQVKKQGKELTKTGINEGVKMGLQQALGLVITEFFAATFDEIIDIYKNGYYTEFNDDFFDVLKKRLAKIGKKLIASWENVTIAASDGFISGFISNLVTVVINAFLTTGRRLVRIIREGFFSLFKAIKILIFPPENITFEERMHEAKKLIATGLIIAAGVIIEEWIDITIKGSVLLEPFSDILTSILVGGITGITITMICYYIDKNKNDKEFLSHLLKQTDEKIKNIELMLTI